MPDRALRRTGTVLAAAATAVLASACIASNVLGVEDRAVEADAAAGDWHETSAAALPGLWRTVAIEGDVAAVLLDVTYWIAAEGDFSGAALFAGPPPAYQVLSGAWRLENGFLVLGDGEPARVEEAGGRLRLTGEQGRLVLARAELR